MSIDHNCLGPLIIGITGHHLTAADRLRLLHDRVGGVILFTRNYRDPEQLRTLTKEIVELRGEQRAPLPIFVDHEGGRVQRFAKAQQGVAVGEASRSEVAPGFTALPAMADLGRCYERDPALGLRLATALGFVLAAELLSCGVHVSFTPVLDLDWGRSGVIGNRAFHQDPATVAVLARAKLHGMALAGMPGCGKHFPGHGWVSADSHHALPVDERSLEAILASDMLPYRSLSARELACIMPAHVVYPAVDDLPAGFSSRWLRDILRDQLHYDGLIISDDLGMAGAAAAGGVVERTRAALEAGCDAVLMCNDFAAIDLVLAAKELDACCDHASGLENLWRWIAPPQRWQHERLRADAGYVAALKDLEAAQLLG